MAHQVTLQIPEHRVGATDTLFNVKRNKVMLGTLKVSQGGLVWRTSPNIYGHFLSWNKFRQMAEEQGKPRAL